MFDIGWAEMALILAVALVVIGPKDLPRVAREIGRWSAKARAMAREFQRSLDDMAREADLQDIKAELEKASRTDINQTIEDMVDPKGDLKRTLSAPIVPLPPPAAVEAEAAMTPPPPAALPKPETVGSAGPERAADQG